MRSDVVVVDTSIAVKWTVQEVDSPIALALFADWLNRGVTWLAPSLLIYEAVNALYQHVRRSEIEMSGVAGAIDDLYDTGLVIDAATERALSVRALRLAQHPGLGPTYDTQFLALAEQEDCAYWTADQRFWTTARPHFPRVRWLGELAASPQP